MKRATRITFSMLMLCGLLLGTGAIVQAAEPGYVVEEAYETTPVTLDGAWEPDEWDAGWLEWMDPEVSYTRFVFKADSSIGYAPNILIDSIDTTDDAGDIWQICIGVPVGGDAPQAGHNKVEIVGHETLTVYEGDGTEWTEIDDSAVTWADSLATDNPAPFDYEHWCVEVIIDKTSIGSASWNGAPPFDFRVAMYDETEDTWKAWPPQSDPDVPEGWGRVEGGSASIPESLSLVTVALLSSVAVAVVFYSKRKRLKL